MDIKMAHVENVDAKKTDVQVLERTESDEPTRSRQSILNSLSHEEAKKLLWRIDIRLVLTLGFMYCASLMDRTNLGIAVVSGMGVDLHLVGSRYSLVTLVFFLTILALQPVVNILGITTVCCGFVRTWDQLIPLRLVLGIFEGGYFPGCLYLLSCWYTRYELQKRNAVFYLVGSLSSAFSGVMAYGFTNLNGLGNLGSAYGQHYGPTATDPTATSGIESGIAGWRWIFFMEGLLSVIIATIAFFTIADFPEKAAQKNRSCVRAMVNEKEASYLVARIEQDRADVEAEPFHWRVYLGGALDWNVWGYGAIFCLSTTCTNSIAFFLPIILKDGMGFGLAAAECLVAPPYVVAAMWTYSCAVLGDRYKLRGPIIVFNGLMGLVGLPLLGFAKGSGVRYFGVFLATAACNATVPCVLTFQANNIRGQWKRALSSAILVGGGGLGGIIGSTVFRKQDAPGYRPGIYATTIAMKLMVVIAAALDLKFCRLNKRAHVDGRALEGLVGFRYTL